MLQHFRAFLQVRLPDGRIVFFRFYDPRVQRLFLKSCDAAQASQLFAVPAAWMCESGDAAALLVHTASDGAVSCATVPIESFRDAVTRYFGTSPRASIDPMEVVGIGDSLWHP